ncbi:hypothetical protein F2Q70_00005916 [Brassica cretica]|uniref:Uncharacterized protein n=1 Tax=Brassica cretica TaxID=69181 RepID=A0A8S9IS97_BRACR|nr:hypothetical protein F2Q70_00005916 [Brassica cretica]
MAGSLQLRQLPSHSQFLCPVSCSGSSMKLPASFLGSCSCFSFAVGRPLATGASIDDLNLSLFWFSERQNQLIPVPMLVCGFIGRVDSYSFFRSLRASSVPVSAVFSDPSSCFSG